MSDQTGRVLVVESDDALRATLDFAMVRDFGGSNFTIPVRFGSQS
jgi:hypothetical protein